MTVSVIPIATGADDGYVYTSAPTANGWPPAESTAQAGDTSANILASRDLTSANNYQAIVPSFRFDTSVIPDNAVIKNAYLEIFVTNRHVTTAQFKLQWYNFVPPIAVSDYTLTIVDDAFSGVAIQDVDRPQWFTIPLTNAPANINKTGYTGFRGHMDIGAGAPTVNNQLEWQAFDSTLYPEARLVVEYDTANQPVQRSRSLERNLGTAPAPLVPRGTTLNDKVLIALAFEGGTGVTVTPPTGFTLVAGTRRDSGTAIGMAVYEKTAGASETGRYTFTLSASQRYIAVATSYFDPGGSTPVVDAQNGQVNASSTSVTAPQVTTTQNDALLAFFGVIDAGGEDNEFFTAPSGMTERLDSPLGLPRTVTNYYMMGGTLVNGWQPMQEGGTAPTDAAFATATGWIVSNIAANNYSGFRSNSERASTTFTTSAQPDTEGIVTGANANGFRTPTPRTGVFNSGNWTFNAVMRSITAAMATGQTAALRWRVYASVNADGTGARELTTTPVESNAVAGTGNTTANQATRTATWAAPEIVLNNEYLFFVCALRITATTGSGTTRDINFRQNTNSRVTTPGFSDSVFLEATEHRPTLGATGSRVATAGRAGANIGQLVALRGTPSGPPAKEITAAGAITSAEAFGSPHLRKFAAPSSITTEEAFGSPTIEIIIPAKEITGAGAIASAEAFDSPTLEIVPPAQQVTSAGAVASEEAFGSPTIELGPAPTIVPLAPDVLLSVTNLSGTVSDIQDNPDSPTGVKLTAVNGSAATEAYMSFPSPNGTLSGTQEMRILLSKNAAAGNDPSVTIELVEAGTTIATLVNNDTVTDTEAVRSYTFSNTVLSDNTGAGVELRIVGNNSTGPGASRRTVEVDAVRWNAYGFFGAQAQNVDPGSISSAEDIGTPTLTSYVEVTSIESAEEFGSPSLVSSISAAGAIPSAEAFGTPTVSYTLSVAAIPSAENFPVPLVVIDQFVDVASIGSAEALGSPAVGSFTYVDTQPIASAEAFGTPALRLSVSVTSIASAEAFGTPRLTLTVTADGISSSEVFGVPALAKTVAVAGNIASAEAFGTAQLNLSVTAAGAIASGEAFGTPNVSISTIPTKNVDPSSIPSAEAFNSPTLHLRLYAISIDSAEVFGTPSLTKSVTVTSIGSAEAFGTPHTLHALRTLPIPSAETFDTPQLIQDQFVDTTAIGSAEAFGTPTFGGVVTVDVTAIPSAEAFGTPSLRASIAVGAIPSAESFGTPSLSIAIAVTSVASGEVFGIPDLGGVAQVGDAGAIPSAETFQLPEVIQPTQITIYTDAILEQNNLSGTINSTWLVKA